MSRPMEMEERESHEFQDRLIVGSSEAINQARLQATHVAEHEVNVLLLGESGVGKELFAYLIHVLSPRKDQPFIAVNCSAMQDTLLENEIFGHEKGSFTGATELKKGKLELAD